MFGDAPTHHVNDTALFGQTQRDNTEEVLGTRAMYACNTDYCRT